MLSEEMISRLVLEIKRFLLADAMLLSRASDEQLMRRIADVADHKLGNVSLSPQERSRVVRLVFSSIRGLGILDEILADDSITEVMINGPDHIFVEHAGRLYRLNKKFDNERQLEDIIQKIVGKAGKEVNQANPIVDTRLPDGSRVNVVLPPVSLSGPIVTIRKFSKTPMTVEMLLKYGSLTREAAAFLEKLVRAKYNIFISGGTGSGKTTFLNALSQYIPKDERVITIEDSAELRLNGIPNLVSLEARNANVEGEGEISIRDLIRTALRMRPDRIIVGEVRGKEAIDMLQAMNTGHDGSLSTGHANSPGDMISRLETMVLMGMDLPLSAIQRQIASGVDILVHLGRLRDKSRKVLSVEEIAGCENGTVIRNVLYRFQETGMKNERIAGKWVKENEMKNREKLLAAGYQTERICGGRN